LVGEDDAEKKKVGARGSTLLSGGEKLRVEAIEHSLSKDVFDCGIRVIYLAKGDKFKGINIGNTINLFLPFRYPNYNSLSPARGPAIFSYPWQDFMNIRLNKTKKDIFFRYKHRAYFYVPYEQVPVCLTSEELATIWHFPNSFVKTPGLSRVPSRRAEAPPNLPVAAVPDNLPGVQAGSSDE